MTRAIPVRRPRGELPRSFAVSVSVHLGLIGGGIALGVLATGSEQRAVKAYLASFELSAAPEAAPAETLEPLEATSALAEPELRESEVWAEPEPFPDLEREPELALVTRASDWIAARPFEIGVLGDEPSPREPAAHPPEPVPAAPVLCVPPAPAPVVSEVVPLSVPPPVYPRLARRAGEEGSVLCRLNVDAEGLVSEVEVVESSGHERLDEAAREALAQWRFQPRRENGRAVPTRILHRVTFCLSPG